MSESLTQTRFRVGGMDCASCAAKVDAAARRVPGIGDVTVSVTTASMTVHHAPGADLAIMQKRVAALGYTVAPAASKVTATHASATTHGEAAEHAAPFPWWRSRKAQLTIASFLALAIAWGVGMFAPASGQWAFSAALLVGLVPIARRAWMAAISGSPFSIEMLMTIAAVGAVLIGAGEEAAIVVFLFLVGELLEGVAAGRARAAIQGLAALVPATLRVERDGALIETPAAAVEVGAIIAVRPGDRIGADGEIIAGESAIDEAPVTGESTPTRKGPGASVFAGTINGDAVLRVRVLTAAADNTIARIVRLVEQAQESKAPTQRFIDRFSRHYTPVVVAVAVVVGIVPPLLLAAPWGDWLYRGLALLLIGCPCALVISTPAAIAAALSAGARRGLLIKGGAVLETLGTITTMALDKTGTLTVGKPVITDIVGYGRSEAQVLAMAAALESGSSHPIAQAILARAAADRVLILPAKDGNAQPGKGVDGRFAGKHLFLGSVSAAEERTSLSDELRSRAADLNDEGKTVAVLLAENVVVGLFAARDEPRADAREGLAALRAAGITPIMLTGDNRQTAQAIAGTLGLEVQAELLPEDKARIVRALQAEGEIVGKVGDGINDAPALAAADVGIAMGGGTDVALETADAAVLHGRLLDVARMVTLSRSTMTNIHQNVAIALGLKAVFLVTTALGITGLWPAILADTGATVLVTMNALRLLR